MKTPCPNCKTSEHSKKNGLVRGGKQRFKCNQCGISYTTEDKYISEGKGKHKHSFDFKLYVCWEYEEWKKKGGSTAQFVRDINDEKKSSPVSRSTVLIWYGQYQRMKIDIETQGYGEVF